MFIQNPSNGTTAKVNERQELEVFAVIENEAQAASDLGDAYNLNTGEVSLSSSTSSAMAYFHSDEDQTFVIDTVICGLRDITGGDGSQKLYAVRNPTAGTLVTAATAGNMNANRNHGSNKTLKSTSLFYKMTASNQTFTDGTDEAMFYIGAGRSAFSNLSLEITKGASIGFRLDCSSITASGYIAIIGYVKDADRG